MHTLVSNPAAGTNPAVILASGNPTLKAMHDVFEARWKAAGSPDGATELCLWDMQRIIDNLPNQRQVNDVLVEAAELLEAWVDIGQPATASEKKLIRLVLSGKAKTRVQMVSDGIPAYQNDFVDQLEALRVAEVLVSGASAATKVDNHGDLVRYNIKGGYIRAFVLME